MHVGQTYQNIYVTWVHFIISKSFLSKVGEIISPVLSECTRGHLLHQSGCEAKRRLGGQVLFGLVSLGLLLLSCILVLLLC